jgi:hypothetical protein
MGRSHCITLSREEYGAPGIICGMHVARYAGSRPPPKGRQSVTRTEAPVGVCGGPSSDGKAAVPGPAERRGGPPGKGAGNVEK